MGNPQSLQGDSIKYYKPKDHTQKAKGLSFFASILSLIIYISIFYIFNLSPYTLFNNHIFWFLMSNNLILIIAADYGAFSSSKHKQDLYDEEHHVSSYVPKYQQVDKKSINPKQELGSEMLIEINQDNITRNIEVPVRVIEVVSQNDPKKPSENSNEKKPLLKLSLEVDESVVIDESVNKMRRPKSMKVEAQVEEENEFTTMTNEELNRKVEEFIQKFNKQIKLQANRNVYQIDEARGF
ncbi:uncharacterized protein LOC113855851 [Abrus precatorius]|uniref:Uncharacterized protein LOC113855851 n=1 Tax=Abrus precatorius TaxID=3816 RepID=A0A8B8KHI6_ABRPR|nr:uncharacterized protein LOC113855851 [Abrus precatorius]